MPWQAVGVLCDHPVSDHGGTVFVSWSTLHISPCVDKTRLGLGQVQGGQGGHDSAGQGSGGLGHCGSRAG